MKRLSYLFITCLLFWGAISLAPVFAVTSPQDEVTALSKQIEERKKKIKDIENSIAVYKKQVARKQTEAASLSNQMKLLDNRMGSVQLDIQDTTERIETTKLEIELLKHSISDKETTITRQQEILAELIRNIQAENNRSLLEILALYNNFSDFYHRIQYLQTLEGDLGNTTKSMRLAKVDLVAKHDQTEEKKAAYEGLSDKLTGQKQDLQEQSQAKSDLLEQTHASEQKYKTLLSNLKSQYQQIDNEISGFEKKMRAKLE